ncbi:MAG TPA: SprB repeat-containing protein [Flavobacteriales bacterium]|nr:SprB repeat-containing protein [Flavobacteriales bacterium]
MRFGKARTVIAVLGCALALNAQALTVWLTPHHEYCGNANGWIQCEVSGGVPPYTFAWSTAETTEDIYGLAAGTYSVTVTDFVGTEATQQATVLAYSAFPLWQSLGQRAFCLNEIGEPMVHAVVDNTGLTEYFLNEGIPTPQFPLTYDGVLAEDFNDGFWTSTLIMANNIAGYTYQVTYTDASGCPGTVELRNGYEAQWPVLSVLDVQGACSSGNNGSIQLAMTAEGNNQVTDLELRRADHSLVSGIVVGYDAMQHQFTSLQPGDYWLVQRIRWLGNSFNGAYLRGLCGDSIMVNVPDLGAACGNVNGTVYMDYNEDCIMGGGTETRVPGALLEFQPGPYYATANTSGAYSINLPSGAYTMQQIATGIAQSCPPPPAAVNVSGIQTINVGDTALVPLDAQVALANGPARPGFELHYAIAQSNLTPASTGNTSTVFTFDPTLSLISASPAPSSSTSSTLTWDQAALGAFGQRSIQVRLQVPPDVGLIGTVLDASVTLSCANTDADLANNSAGSSVTVTGSYDPNDKRAQTSSRSSQELYYIDEDEWIDYTVRFQNTGTDTAFTVIITDTLPSTLDPASISWGASSHAHTRALIGQGLLKFIFPNILLPDSNVNEPLSHGFVSFRIRPRLPLVSGTQIENIANIYFDFNPPVITEPSVLVAEFSTGASEQIEGAVQVWPNPFIDHLRIRAPEAITYVRVIAMDGREVLRSNHNSAEVMLVSSRLTPGCYLIEVRGTTGKIARTSIFKQ